MKQQTKFKQTEMGMIPEGWEVKELREFAELKKGMTYRSKDYCSENEGYMFINLKCVAPNGGFRKEGIKFIKIEPKSHEFVEEGDILIANTDLTHNREVIGSPIKIPKLDRKACFSLDLSKINIIKGLDKDYFFYFLRSPYVRNFMVSSGTGTTVVHLAVSNVPNMLICIPPLPEQCAIAKILSDLDSKIELNQQMNVTLEKIGQALFKHWFIDFEFPNEEGKPYKSSGGEMVDSELGKIPRGWQIKEIDDCGKVVCGKTPPTENEENYGNDIPFITIPDMRGNVFVVKTEKQLSRLGAESQAKKELPPLAVCVSCIATPGLVSLTSQNSHTNQQINSIICNEDVSPYFMFYNMREKSEDIQTMGLGGTATLNLNTRNFSKIKILVPDRSLMEQFHSIVAPLFEQLLKNSMDNLTLIDIRDSLLPRLMSGKIRVGSVE